MRETSFINFGLAADLEACVQLLPTRRFFLGGGGGGGGGGGSLASVTPLSKRSHTQITKGILCFCIGGSVKHTNLVLSFELVK